MSARNLTYFKFVSTIIETGLWAKMSSAARALYPVLLRFSDSDFKPVYPGSKLLLELTGFKQKSTLRKARQELVELGLVTLSKGSGRTNTYYSFRFDTLGVKPAPPTETKSRTLGAEAAPLSPSRRIPSGDSSSESPYNKIHISINNNVQDAAEGKSSLDLQDLKIQYGENEVQKAVNECRLSGMQLRKENLEKILYRNPPSGGVSWTELAVELNKKISRGSMVMIENAFLEEKGGMLFFSNQLPGHLKVLLEQVSGNVFFEPEFSPVNRRDFFEQEGAKL